MPPTTRSRKPKQPAEEIDKSEEVLNETENTTSTASTKSTSPTTPTITTSDQHRHHHHHQHPRARVYKRWLFLTAVITFVVAWLLHPAFTSTIQGGEGLFERELLNQIPEILRNRLAPFLRPFTATSTATSKTEGPRSPGRRMKKAGASAHFPVIMIPGVTSVGLELWEGRRCAKGLFRQRLWGTLTMLKTVLMDKVCWMDHLRVNPLTGADPPGIRIRPAQGLEAADFLLPGFWVWAKIIAGLAEVGYDHTNLHMAAYDWRLDLESIEARDHYFSKLKMSIELFKQAHGGKKVVIIAHSLGSNVWLYFQKWVEARAGDRGWIDKHIEAFVNIAGPLLGAPKSISTILSGETRDTATLGTLETYLLESFLSKQERLSLFRSWMGGFAIFPKGGSKIWGSARGGSPDADQNKIKGFDLLRVNASSLEALKQAEMKESYSFDEIDQIHDRVLPEEIVKRYRSVYSPKQGIASPANTIKNDQISSTWMNPLESRLPHAPKMKIYCLYGVGHDTERAYEYKLQEPLLRDDRNSLDPKNLALPAALDRQAEDRSIGLYNGIYHVDGDATVPLISLSYMCTHAWRQFDHLNPSKMRVITREYAHQPKTSVTELRGGPGSSEHVDILGNHELLLDILKIATNQTEALDEVIYSDIKTIAEKINLSF